MDCSCVTWNIRGLNNPARRRAVASFLNSHQCNLVCLQETKLVVVTNSVISETLGSRFVDNFAYLPADGTRGGILVAASADHFAITALPHLTGAFSITVNVRDLSDNSEWSLSCVYGP